MRKIAAMVGTYLIVTFLSMYSVRIIGHDLGFQREVALPSLQAASLQEGDNLLQPEDLTYLGAFRLPDSVPGASDAEIWEYGGQALTYRPDGDPGGEADGYPGSLFGTGNDIYNYVSEISIPAPGLSRNLEELNIAATIQGFHDVRGGLFEAFSEMPRVGMEYLPAQNGQTSAKLYLTWSQHLIDDSLSLPTHAWCEIDLSHPHTTGAWWIGHESPYSTTGYLFAIPKEWADLYSGGAMLATGRFRDGGLSGMGPALFAFAPWLDGNPPAPGMHLHAKKLMSYSRWEDPTADRLNNYHDSDEWEDGAWITAGGKSSVVFVGTKGGGASWWYGYASPAGDGLPCPDTRVHEGAMCFNPDRTACDPGLAYSCNEHISYRGWWSSRFDAQMIFYDPADFAAVLSGHMASYEPQPYATLDIDQFLFLNAVIEPDNIGTGDQRRYRIGEMAYDRQRNLLYVLERFADGAKPVVHVWRIAPRDEAARDGVIRDEATRDEAATPVPVTITMNLPAGWSMISLPVVPDDVRACIVFPDAVAVLRFTTQYAPVELHEPLEQGVGYWIYLPSSRIYRITGLPFENYTAHLPSGWSMIGSCTYPSAPSTGRGIIRAVYDFAGNYKLLGSEDTLGPGKGYWIYLSEEASLEVKRR